MLVVAEFNNDENFFFLENKIFIQLKKTTKTYLQLISLKKKKNFSQSTIYKSFHKLLFISIQKNSFQLKKLMSMKKSLSLPLLK